MTENGQVEDPPTERPLTREEVQRGLFPRTLSDLRHRTRCFSILAAGEAAHRQRQAKKKPKR